IGGQHSPWWTRLWDWLNAAAGGPRLRIFAASAAVLLGIAVVMTMLAGILGGTRKGEGVREGALTAQQAGTSAPYSGGVARGNDSMPHEPRLELAGRKPEAGRIGEGPVPQHGLQSRAKPGGEAPVQRLDWTRRPIDDGTVSAHLRMQRATDTE